MIIRYETILTDEADNTLAVEQNDQGHIVTVTIDGNAYEFPLNTRDRQVLVKALGGVS